MDALKQTDPEVYDLIRAEERYEIDSVRLIPSENYVSRAVLEATGSVLTNKYSEGYPGRRYYEGQRYIDQIETLVDERAKDAVRRRARQRSAVLRIARQPRGLLRAAQAGRHDHGAGAAARRPSDPRMARQRHRTYSGAPVHYPVDRETQRIDYDAVRDLAQKERPKIIVAGATAYPRQFDFKMFGEIAKEVGAFMLADISHISGLIVAGAHPDPVPYADVVTTTTHKTLRGPRGAMILCRKEVADKIDKAVFPGLQGGPHNHTTAAIGVALKEAATPAFKEYGRQIVRNAKAMAAELIARGFDLVSGGTDNHLILIDLTNKKVIGKKAAQALDRAGIVCNYNTVPYDPRKPFSPSGLRLGTPAVTSRGMGEDEMRQIARWIDQAIAHADDEAALARISGEVTEMCRRFPAPGIAT